MVIEAGLSLAVNLARRGCSIYVLTMGEDTLSSFPYVKVRLACRKCSREGAYKLARLADKYGANVGMGDLLKMLVGDCKFIDPRHPFADRCGGLFRRSRLAGSRPPVPACSIRRRMRVAKGGKE